MSGARPILLGALLACAYATGCDAEDVSFAERFVKAAQQSVVTVQAGSGDVLVIEGGTYTVGGRRLIVAAEHVRVLNDAIIRQFDPTEAPQPKTGTAAIGPTGGKGEDNNCGRSGCPGKPGLIGGTGTTGDPGRVASDVSFDVGEVVGPGVLTLSTVGQTGGRGQQGGKGGTGGQGGHGAQKSCGGVFGLDTRAGPGEGGDGGPGGEGGAGGQGGPGGLAGNVYLRNALFGTVARSRLKVVTTGGEGGKGGEPGVKGDWGQGNEGGEGNSCGDGGGAGRHGRDGTPGQPGPAGRSGIDGSVLYTDFKGGSPSPLPPGILKVSRTVTMGTHPGDPLNCNQVMSAEDYCFADGFSYLASAIVARAKANSDAQLSVEAIQGGPRCVRLHGTMTPLAFVSASAAADPSSPLTCLQASATFDVDIFGGIQPGASASGEVR